MKLNAILASILWVAALASETLAQPVSDFAEQCVGVDNRRQFNVLLGFQNQQNPVTALCNYLYSRCPFTLRPPARFLVEGSDETTSEATESGLMPEEHRHLMELDTDQYLAKGAWESEADKPFEWLESRTFLVKDSNVPSFLQIQDRMLKGFNCARALTKDKVRDFILFTPTEESHRLNINDWWEDRISSDSAVGQKEPLHITVVPFQGIIEGQTCVPVNDASFDTKRSIAVILSPHEGQLTAPPDSVYCDISKNPQECLQKRKWTFDADKTRVVLESTLKDPGDDSKSIDIFIPDGWDLKIPISSYFISFDYRAGFQAYNMTAACKEVVDFLNGDRTTEPTLACLVKNAKEKTKELKNQVKITGLGRINGLAALTAQNENNYGTDILSQTFPDATRNLLNNVDVAYYAQDSKLLQIASVNENGKFDDGGKCGKTSNFAIDVAGPTVAWGSPLGQSAVALNSAYVNEGFSAKAKNFCVRLFDFKILGNWIDRADGPDLMGKGSRTEYTYTQTADDNIKVAVDKMERLESTVLQGSAGSAVMVGSYGYTRDNGIKDSVVKGVYVHRVLQNSNQCGSAGGLVATQSCGQSVSGNGNTPGLTDFTLKDVTVAYLGSNKRGANSIGQPFGIGVNRGSGFCNNIDFAISYPIKDLKFENVIVSVNPACNSNFYDDSNVVAWGNGTMPSAQFFESKNNDQCLIDAYKGAVVLNDERSPYAVCGNTPAGKRCIGTTFKNLAFNGNGTDTDGLDKTNVSFPQCNARRLRHRE